MRRTPLSLAKVSTLAIAAALGAIGAAEAAVIEGRVTDGSGRTPLDGAIIRVVETGQTVSAGRDGRFRIAALAPGSYTLIVTYIGADQQSFPVTLETDASVARPELAIGADLELADNILVYGQRGALNSALSQQRASDKVITVLSSDAIGQLPDENVAEAARRAAGVNILNDQGEGRFVSIRGSDPNFVSTTINGVRIPSPEADARQTPLDVIDSDILSAVVITKSLTPDIDADSIGGNVEIRTLSGLDQDKLFLKVKAAGLYANQTEDFSHRYSAVAANRFLDGKLGIAGSIAWQRRDFGSENVEVGGPDYLFEDNLAYPEELEQRDYIIRRERLTGALNVDYQATDAVRFYVRGIYSDFSDDEFRTTTTTAFGDAAFDAGASGPSLAVVGATEDDPLGVERAVRSRFEEQTIYSVVGGAEYTAGAFSFDWSAAYSFADETEPGANTATYAAEFEEGLFGVDVSDSIIPRLAFPDAAAEAAYFDAGNYEFDEYEVTNGLTEDDELAFTANLRYDTDIFGAPGYFQTGGKVRLRDKFLREDIILFDGFDGDDLILADLAADVPFDIDRINPSLDPRAFADFFAANESQFELNEVDSAIESSLSSYSASENIYAGYALAQRTFGGRVSVVAGVRVEHTNYSALGNNVLVQEFEDAFAGDVTGVLDPNDLIPPPATPGTLIAEDVEFEFDADEDETILEAVRVFTSPIEARNSYTDVLPSVNVKWDVSDSVVARFGYYKSLARPNIEAAAPRIAIEQGEDLAAEAGNPDLNRQRADNIDATLEWYPGQTSLLSVGFFWKSIDDFIAPVQTSREINGVVFDEVSTFENLSSARITGVEATVQKPLDFLPGLLSGFIISANYTFIDSEATLDDGREISLPGQSRHVATGILGYERGPLNLRFATTFRDEYLDEIGSSQDADGNPLDRFVDSHIQLDVAGKYQLTDRFQLFAEAKNVNNRPFVATVRPEGFGRLNAQFEEYGWSARFGVQFVY